MQAEDPKLGIIATMNTLQSRLWLAFACAVGSRLATLLLGIVADGLFPDHHASGVALFPLSPPMTASTGTVNSSDWTGSSTFAFAIIRMEFRHHYLSTFVKWDAAHYLSIAKNGYVKEENFAFGPLYPALVSFLSTILHQMPLTSSWNENECLVLSGVFISNAMFVVSAVILTHLLDFFSISNRHKALAIVCHCLSPASVFFSTVYTESLFCSVTFAAIYLCLVSYAHHPPYIPKATKAPSRAQLMASIQLAMGTVLVFISQYVRSTGIFSYAYCFFGIVRQLSKFPAIATFQTQLNREQLSLSPSSIKMLITAGLLVLTVIIAGYPTWTLDCKARDFICSAEMNPSFEFSDPFYQSVCTSTIFSNAYAILQRKYWNVGFLRYYQFRQLPNFLLAAPTVVIAGYALQRASSYLPQTYWSVQRYLETTRRRYLAMNMPAAPLIELLTNNLLAERGQEEASAGNIAHCSRAGQQGSLGKQQMYSFIRRCSVDPFSAQLVLLLLTGLLFAHVQILTRLLCASSPLIPVAIADLLSYPNKMVQRATVIYIVIFFAAGTALHVNFLPWT